VHLYLIQSFQKFEAENFFRNTVVEPPNRLNRTNKRFYFQFNFYLNIPVGNTNPTTYEINSRLDEEMIFLGK